MSVTVHPSASGDCRKGTPAVIAEVVRVESAHQIEPHAHVRGQMIYSARQALELISDGTHRMLPPRYGLWVPPKVAHAVRATASTEYSSLFVAPAADGDLPPVAQVMPVSKLLVELTRAAANFDPSSEREPERRMRQVILDQLAAAGPAPVALSMPRSARLRRLAEQLWSMPAEHRDLVSWADELCMSPRNLARRLRRETGLSFGQWTRRARVLKAMERLAAGVPVQVTAWDVGYRQVSAFISMFRRETGMTPAQYARTVD